MFPFTKTPNDLASNYRKLNNLETHDDLKSPDSEAFSKIDGQRNYRAAFYGLAVVYLITIVTVFGIWKFGRSADSSSPTSLSKPFEIPRDQKIIFQKAEEFEVASSEKADSDPWGSLFPAGRGFIEVPVDVTHPDGSTSVENQYFCISMFHQLHCIASLKAAFESKSHDSKKFEHLGHCFDYLRQGVMCAGDMTLEPAYKLGDAKGVNGWNVEHQCKDYEAMKEVARAHRYLNNTGIL
ncbi:Oxidase ustYa [Lachnellula suecica]|uniref:Oxidase ustYa n=1 Tax=Lachnellula suecica TaxID=602035 RepID=A0A8T9CKI8_9HELO|nr:Oxidase ustYa [Lachnellula suecica]